MKKLFLGVLCVSGILLTGCEEGSEYEINNQQEKLLMESNKQLGMPAVTNFFEKELAKQIIELRDQPDLTTYAYMQAMDGKFIFLGRCIGFGLPYTTQYTNPETYYSNGATLPQADPNGLYNSETTNATWLILINEETNEQEIIYSEPSIIVTQSKLPKRLIAEWSLPENY